MINLFIDSNIWLSLYHFTSDDLNQFRKLKKLLNSEIKLFITEQLVNEVYRNREVKLKEALNKFEKFDLTFPVFCKGYPQYDDFYLKYRELQKAHQDWLSIINKDIIDYNLQVDKVIYDFFTRDLIIPCDNDIITRAVTRYNIGNPPGKDKSYGDAINWECLLVNVPEKEDLFIITADKDFYSIIDNKRFNHFLEADWTAKKKSSIIVFKSLVDFLDQNFNNIILKSEKAKEDLIEGLEKSINFMTTHSLIAELAKYSDWTDYQIEKMCQAAIDNSQIKKIMNDKDIHDFYSKLLSKFHDKEVDSDAINEVIVKLNKNL